MIKKTLLLLLVFTGVASGQDSGVWISKDFCLRPSLGKLTYVQKMGDTYYQLIESRTQSRAKELLSLP